MTRCYRIFTSVDVYLPSKSRCTKGEPTVDILILRSQVHTFNMTILEDMSTGIHMIIDIYIGFGIIPSKYTATRITMRDKTEIPSYDQQSAATRAYISTSSIRQHLGRSPQCLESTCLYRTLMLK
jgi:hypothetical protein